MNIAAQDSCITIFFALYFYSCLHSQKNIYLHGYKFPQLVKTPNPIKFNGYKLTEIVYMGTSWFWLSSFLTDEVMAFWCIHDAFGAMIIRIDEWQLIDL